MAGEFKKFDEEFRHNKGRTFENICKEFGTPTNSDWSGKKSFYDFMPGWQHTIYGRDEILAMVYRAEDHRDWQFFRVGLHGLFTAQKLWCLAWYYSDKPCTPRKIRIDNYLGALVRGGQLNAKLEIMR